MRPLLLVLYVLSCRVLPVLLPLAALAGPATLQIKPDPGRALVRHLGWDSEGGSRADTNLLRAGTGLALRIQSGGQWREAINLPAQREGLSDGAIRYRLSV